MTAVRTTLNEPGGYAQPITPTPGVPCSTADEAVRYLGSGKQDADALLTSIAGLTFGANSFIYGTDTDTATVGTVTAFARSFMAAADEAAFKQTVNLEIGVDVQPYDADLAAIAALTTTAYGRSLLTHADEAAFKAAVNLEANTDFYAPGGTDVAIPDGGTGAGDAATAFANLKQAASTSATGVVELATDAEVRSAASGVVMTADQLETASVGVALTDAATVAVDWDTGINFTLTVTANRAIGNPTNGQPGTWRTILVQGNDATARTLTFGNQFLGEVPTITDCTSSKWYMLMIYCASSSHFVVSSKRAKG